MTKKVDAMSEMAVFSDLDLFGSSGNLENEIEILKSRKLASAVAKNLQLNKKYIIKGSVTGFHAHEYFKNTPIIINHSINDSLLYASGGNFELTIVDNQSYTLSETDGENFGKKKFGEKNSTSIGEIIVSKTDKFKDVFISKNFTIQVSKLNRTISTLKNSISISTVNKNASVLEISTKGPVIDKNNAIINELIQQHELDQLKDQNQISEKTRDFIKERMEFISKELSAVDNANQKFKTDNKLTDVSSDAQLLLTKASEIEKQIIERTIQLELTNYMNDFINQHDDVETLLPSNLGIEDISIATMTQSYNALVLERNKLLIGSSEQNPSITKLTGQINSIKTSLENSLQNIVSASNIELNALKKKANIYSSQLASVPGYEKEYRDIARQQQIKETLYLYLLQKREENEIALSANIANTKVIDHAYSNGIPISPKKKIVYLGALLLGLLIPAGTIYLRDLLDNKVHSKKDLEKYNLPHLANIPLSKENEKLVALNNPRSVLSEAFRILRTNVSFLFDGTKEKGNTLFVTSTIAAEGKTFVSLNIAHSLALTGKKVVVVGLDLRAPKLLQYLDLPLSKKGASDYIVNHQLTIEDVTFAIPGTENLDIIASGTTPPNPSELLMKPRLNELFEKLKLEYDYIVVDTAPCKPRYGYACQPLILRMRLYMLLVQTSWISRMLDFPAKTICRRETIEQHGQLLLTRLT